MSPRLQICVLVDALGWRFIEGRNFMDDLLPHRQPLRTVLGYSSGAIPTILTGKDPVEHGHWNLFYYDPQGSPFRWLEHLRFLPRVALENRLTRKVLKELGRRALGLGPLFDCCVAPRLLPFFSWVEKRNIFERGGVSGAPSIFDRLAQRGIASRTYSYHRSSDAQILRRARMDLAARSASFYFIYLSEIDALLHQHCQDDALVESRLAWYARELRGIFQHAREQDPKAEFAIFSDHGMTPVRARCDLVKQIEALGFRTPKDYLAVYDSTMARFWFFDERARRGILECLHALPCGRILPDAELEELGILFPDRRYGEVIVLLDPGWLLHDSGFSGGGWLPSGMHGYHPDDPSSDAVFLSSDVPSARLRTIADVYGYMQQAIES